MFYSLIYISKAVKLMQEADLLHLLQESRDWNESHQLTGMLLYIEGRFIDKQEGRFMQVLEGTREEVEYIFEKIKTDSRHQQVILLSQQNQEKRKFSTWSMGFDCLNLQEYRNTPGYFELDDSFLESYATQSFNVALNYLKSFYDMNKQYNFS